MLKKVLFIEDLIFFKVVHAIETLYLPLLYGSTYEVKADGSTSCLSTHWYHFPHENGVSAAMFKEWDEILDAVKKYLKGIMDDGYIYYDKGMDVPGFHRLSDKEKLLYKPDLSRLSEFLVNQANDNVLDYNECLRDGFNFYFCMESLGSTPYEYEGIMESSEMLYSYYQQAIKLKCSCRFYVRDIRHEIGLTNALPTPSSIFKVYREGKKAFRINDYYIVLFGNEFLTGLTWGYGESILILSEYDICALKFKKEEEAIEYAMYILKKMGKNREFEIVHMEGKSWDSRIALDADGYSYWYSHTFMGEKTGLVK